MTVVHPIPAAEVVVDPDLVGRLLSEQRPDLAALPRSVLAHGWDNVLVRVGSDVLARLPRRAAAASLVDAEQAWLPDLAPRLPLPVPVPVFAGSPGSGYPWRWSLVPFLPGRPARPDDLDAAAAGTLGGFLGALHRPAPEQAPENPVRGVALARRAASFAENLHLVVDAGLLTDADDAHTLWSTAMRAPTWAGPPLWLHGDVHPANLLVDDGGLCAVVDFGDLTAGDPASDLAVGWMLADATARERFWEVYTRAAAHPVDDDLRLRAHGWALHLGVAILARSADHRALQAIGARALDAALAGK